VQWSNFDFFHLFLSIPIERMYEQQVFKDGIRRTLTTTSGSATERHFNQDDLKKLFSLEPKGICKMLETMKRVVRTHIDSIEQVVGVTSHDSVYCKTAINIECKPVENPFSGTPNKKAMISNSALSNLPSQGSDLISQIANLTLSPDAAKKRNHKKKESITIDSQGDHSNIQFNKENVINEGNVTDAERSTSFLDMIEEVDDLSAKGKIEESVLLLLKALDRDNLEKEQKLIVHKKISCRVVLCLGWHKEW
jgi:hypothetical protein